MAGVFDDVVTCKTAAENIRLQKQITEKLYQRDTERLAEVDRKKSERLDHRSEKESASYFSATFANERAIIEKKLEDTNTVPNSQLIDHFDSLLLSWQNLQRFVSHSTLFLSSYEVRSSMEILNSLQKKIKMKRDSAIPKKKFAFKGQKKFDTSGNIKPAELVEGQLKKTSIQDTAFQAMDCGFSDRIGETLHVDNSEIFEKDVSLSRLKDCIMKLHGSPNTLHIDKLQGCKVFTGPVFTSVFIDSCKDCTFVIACQQLRMHTTSDCDIYLHVTSRAIVEDSKGLRIAPYNYRYDGLDEDYKKSRLNRETNNWDDLDDFNWLASDKHSPNWSVLSDEQRVKTWEV
ncbi:PREDICTED: tubulin-specific chaperone C-like [Priapulus caudatus]|uniref:Tubulin-specific chaperone C-like n=1 Tax=Priapulus caudatus TaxID=37621 RepID=A0ABM1EBB2_PRICU|nr:PREDICTED: tubulin-specific chaperone C-like [Priapulus caudatus]